jgi:hypothetical protein
MVTNLLGRKVKPIYSGGEPSTIVAVFMDRGVTTAIMENPEHQLWESSTVSLRLLPETKEVPDADV